MTAHARLKWLTAGQWRPTFDSVQAIAEPPVSGKDATTLTLAMGATSIHLGSSVSAVATLKSVGTGLNGKTVILESKDPTGGTWTTQDTKTTNASGVATFASQSPTGTVSYRARFVTDASYVGSQSTAKNVTVQVLTTLTKRYSAIWANSYNNNTNAQVGPATEAQQGDNLSGDTMTKRKALIGFDVTKIQTALAAVVTPLYIRVGLYTNAGKSPTSPAHYVLGWHDFISKPGTYNPARVVTPIDSDMDFALGYYTWEEIISPAGLAADMAGWASGAICGVAIGPPPSTDANQYYLKAFGYAAGAGQPVPYVEFQYTAWV